METTWWIYEVRSGGEVLAYFYTMQEAIGYADGLRPRDTAIVRVKHKFIEQLDPDLKDKVVLQEVVG